MDILCTSDICPVLLNSTCVFYEGSTLIYTGITTNDSLQTALQKIDAKFGNAMVGYIFTNGVNQSAPGAPVGLGGSLTANTSIGGNFTLTFTGNLQAARHITTGGTASQFVKGDGTLDSTAYQAAGNYITALTGDVIAAGPGSAAASLAVVNSNPGTYGTGSLIPVVTVDTKGRVTALTTTAINVPSGILSFVGDVYGSGTTGSTTTLTLSNVNSNIYTNNTFLKFRVNAKGLVTGAAPITDVDIQGALGYVPVPNTRTITINGITQTLQANRSWILPGGGSVTNVSATAGTGISVSVTNPATTPNITITNTAPDRVVSIASGTGINVTGTYPNFTVAATNAGTVTSVTASAPLASSGGATPNITIVQSTSVADGYLSSTDWNTFNSKQPAGSYVTTSRTISTNAPLQGGGDLTSNRTLSITQAGIATDGFLSSIDWNIFNGKQSSGNYITSLTGEATGSGPGTTTVTLSTPAVTGKLLTGVNITGGTVVDTDTILQGFGKLQNQINGLIGGSIYQGIWNAATNTPTLTSGVGTDGHYYIVNVAGNTNLNGITDWKVGDWAIFHGGAWQKVDNTDAVVSVNGYTGAVSLVSSDIPEGLTNLYYTSARARTAISLTTTGTSGAATYNNTTGVLNVPNYTTDVSGYVPYTGATGPVNLGNYNLTIKGIPFGTGAKNSTNIGIGQNAIGYLLGGLNNIAIGSDALFVTSGSDSVAIGYGAGYYLNSGSNNVVIGSQAAYNAGPISNTVAIGKEALRYNQGTGNTAIGYAAGMQLSGSYNTILGIYDPNAVLNNNVIISDGQGNIRFQWDGTNIKLNGNIVGSNAYTSTPFLPLAGGTMTGGLVINPANTGVVGLNVASNTVTLRSDSTNPFPRQLTTTMGSGTLVKIQAAGFGATYVTDLGFYTSTSSAVNTTPNLYLTGGDNRVGINTTTPAYTLDVVGTAGVSGALTANSFVKIGGTSVQFLMADGSVTTAPSLTGFVPYTGATANVNLGTFDLTADVITGATGSFTSSGSANTLSINHSSGSGIALNISKGGNGEGLYINKTSGSGNAATIVGTLNATTLVKSGGTSAQFLKADGSVDSNTYLKGSLIDGFIPYWNSTLGALTNSFIEKFGNFTQIGGSGLDVGSGMTISGRYNNVANAPKIFSSDESTGMAHISFINTGGGFNLGVNKSTANGLMSGASAYATVLTSLQTTNLEFGTDATKRMTINGTTGAVTLTGALSGTSATFTGAFEAGKTGGVVTAGDLSVDPTSLSANVYVGRLSSTSNDNTNFIVRNRIGSELFKVIGNTGAATFSSSVNAGGRIISGPGAYEQGGFVVPYSTASSASRNWKMTNDEVSFGDFAIKQSTTQNGETNIHRFYISPSGNVGIGTTAPGRKLQINVTPVSGEDDGINVYNGTTNFLLTRTASTYTYRGVAPLSGMIYSEQNISLLSDGGNVTFHTNGGERMRITAGGNVGIGTTDIASVGSNLVVAQSGTPNISTIRRLDASNTGAGRLFFQATNSSGSVQNVGFIESGLENSSTNGYLMFASNTTERMRITSGGITRALRLQVSNAGILAGNFCELGHDDNVGFIDTIRAVNSGDFHFRFTGTSRMTVTTGGSLFTNGGNGYHVSHRPIAGSTFNIGFSSGNIGTNGPFINATVNGTADTSAVPIFFNASAFSVFIGYSEQMRLVSGGTLYIGGGIVQFYGSWSDRRLKENLEVIANPLEKISKLTGYTFDWTKDSPYRNNPAIGERIKDAGLIAQDVEEVLPEVVTEKDKKKHVNYNGVTALHTEGIKELIKENQELKNRLSLLEERLILIESKLL